MEAAFDLQPGARVVVAMSGGVDSSVVAALAKQAGYEAIGVTLQLYDHGAAIERKGACCAGQDIHDARRVADRLGMPHYVLDFEAKFRDEVMRDFADAYARGETPVPCVACNRTVKFRDLVAIARDLGAAAMATGHYARRVVGTDGAELHAASDPRRDQSWFLHATTKAQLDFIRFPLGGLPKDRTRAIAADLGLAVADKADSQDICFVPNGGYAGVVQKLRPDAARPGEIVDLSGRVVGRHDGIIHYTIGQRRGLGVAAGEPLFVIALDAARARVIVGPKTALACGEIRLANLNWLGAGDAPYDGRNVTVRVRSAGAMLPARLERREGWRVVLDRPELGVAPGQACVIYDGARVLGGGTIAATVPFAGAVDMPVAAVV